MDAVMAYITFIRIFIRLKENKKRKIFESLKESRKLNFIPIRVDFLNTGNDRYSGDGINGIDRFSAHIQYQDVKANFCGRKKEGHFHYKNFLRALK